MDLATKVAALQFNNPDYVLLFRGQRQDYRRYNARNTSFTSLAPSLFRGIGGANPSSSELKRRFKKLKRAEDVLINLYDQQQFAEIDRLKRQQILRWSILQHYKVCPTPLIDVTHSLRIAASFASDGADREAFIFVLGVPNLSGAITASAEAGIQIVRLSSVCPPTAIRPHIQEGYLLGEYPEMTGYDQKQYYTNYEIDFGRCLIAKCRFNPRKFWKRSDAFPQVGREALYPDQHDPLFDLAKSVRNRLRIL